MQRHLEQRGVQPGKVIRLDGAVETAVRLGVADVIADVVETGTTLRQAGLEVFGEPILVSGAVLVRRSGSAGADPAWTPPSTSSSGGCAGSSWRGRT